MKGLNPNSLELNYFGNFGWVFSDLEVVSKNYHTFGPTVQESLLCEKTKLALKPAKNIIYPLFEPKEKSSCVVILAKCCLYLGLLWKSEQKSSLWGIKSSAKGRFFSKSFLALNINEPLTHCFTDNMVRYII